MTALGGISPLGHSLLPTPFHRLEALSRELGASLWCKRDDLTGFGFGGNKTRKLDYLVAEAKAAGATDLVAVGGVQSNFCRMAAAYAARERLACTLVLGASAERARTGGNLLLDALFGARIVSVASDDWDAWEEAARALEARLRAEGRVPYHLPVGGSTPTGALGYAAAMSELLADADRAGVRLGTLVHATSSAGTQAGLLAGRALTGWGGRIIGVAVAKSEAQLRAETEALAQETAARIGARIDSSDVHVDARQIGAGYAVPTAAGHEAQHLFARLEGIVLDEVYTAKAAAGLVAMLRADEVATDAAVVFLHTGGAAELFSRPADSGGA
jgi:D-cysteine desulfhydrase family pyridoxal phosphate-dependent enzyme